MSFFTPRIWAFQQAVRTIWQTKSVFSLAIILAGLSLSIPAFLGTLFWCLSKPVINIPTQTEMTIFTDRTLSSKQVRVLCQNIDQIGSIQTTKIISRQQAQEMVNRSLGLKQRDKSSNPLPDIIIATLAPNVSADAIHALDRAIQKMPGVDTVAYDSQWAAHSTALFKAISIVATVLGIVIFMLVGLVIASSVRMTTNTAKDEIRVLYIFGASDLFILRPYVWRGLITLSLAALLSYAITWIGIYWLKDPIADVARLYNIDLTLTLPASDWILLYIFSAGIIGAIIGGLTTKDALRQIRKQ